MGNHGAPACGRAITVAPARVTAALVILGGCFWALSQVLTRIPMGLAYAIWFGAGIALICVARLARAQATVRRTNSGGAIPQSIVEMVWLFLY
jgi:predicted benzoate:H+ symporter BenE